MKKTYNLRNCLWEGKLYGTRLSGIEQFSNFLCILLSLGFKTLIAGQFENVRLLYNINIELFSTANEIKADETLASTYPCQWCIFCFINLLISHLQTHTRKTEKTLSKTTRNIDYEYGCNNHAAKQDAGLSLLLTWIRLYNKRHINIFTANIVQGSRVIY